MNKNYLILGATSGIGLDLTKKVIKKNFVYCLGRNFNDLNKYIRVNRIKKNYKNIKIDLNKKNASNVFKKINKKLDIIVVCSGLHRHSMIKFFDEKIFDELMNVNLINPVKIISKLYSSGKINKTCRIVMLSSIQALKSYITGSLGYAVAKSGILSAVKALAVEMANENIVVNAITPAIVNTPLINKAKHLSSEVLARDKKKYLLGKNFLTTKEIIDVINFLTLTKSLKITGESIGIDAGYLLTR